MQLRYDEKLVEAAVFLCAKGLREGVQPFVADATKGCTPHPLQIARFHRERDGLYTILDPDERNAAFFKLHLEWFREWGLEQLLLKLVDEFPLLRKSLAILAFRKARGRNEEGAELFVSTETGRNAVVALLPERFACESPSPSGRGLHLTPFLRHEFMHLNDMLAPAFDYSPQLHLAGQNPAQQRLTRERYRLLWDITIDGRLTHAKRATTGFRESHRAAFDRAFGFWSDTRRDEVFGSLWDGTNPRHGGLLAIASDPREVKTAHQPLPGAPCPLCGFSTFAWAERGAVSPVVRAAIQAEFPGWLSEQGVCRRCVATYEAGVKYEVPVTIFMERSSAQTVAD